MIKQVIESNRPEQYYFELMKKKELSKRLTQCERIFIEMYANKDLPCYYFTKQMSPSILQYNARIFTLRKQGFIIKCEFHIVGKEKHSTYTLDKTHLEVFKVASLFQKLFSFKI